MAEGLRIVTSKDIEELSRNVSASVTNPNEGIFGPASLWWRVNRESALFLAAGRALLLQLAHPWVAAAIAEHSQTFRDPIGRFHRTFRVIFPMVFGTLEEALAASRQLYGRHTTIRGTMHERIGAFDAGSRYEANELQALRWVFATLVDSAVAAHGLVLPPLNPAELDRYYRESWKLAALFGIDACDLPQSWEGFAGYNRAMWNSEVLTVSGAAREIASALLHGAGSRLYIPRWYRALTADLLPPRLRAQFELPWTGRDQVAAARAKRWLPQVHRLLPEALRYVGPYRQACARLEGRSESTPSIRWTNRFWMGQDAIGSRLRGPLDR